VAAVRRRPLSNGTPSSAAILRLFSVRAGAGAVAGSLLIVWLGVNAAKEPALFVNDVLSGVTAGAIYALVALGFTLIYSTLELIHFAHGDVMVLGAMLAAVTVGFLPAALLPAVVIPACALTTGLIYHTVYRRLRQTSRLAVLVASIGVAFILKDLAQVWAEATFLTFRNVPDVLPHGQIASVLGVTYSWDDLIVVLFVAAVVVALSWLLQATRAGKAVRAAGQDAEAAAVVGVDVDRAFLHVFLIAGALAGAASLLYAFYFRTIAFGEGLYVSLIALTAAVVGGIGNLAGALIGALLIGLVQSLNDGLTWQTPGSDWTRSIVFGVLICVLVFRPQGILGGRSPEPT
jgi:branched-chain amino acid transport system permease protein